MEGWGHRLENEAVDLQHGNGVKESVRPYTKVHRPT